MESELRRQLKSIRQGDLSPSEEWVRANRVQLLSQIKNTLPSHSTLTLGEKLEHVWAGMSIFLPRSFVYNVVRPVAVVVLVAVLATGSYAFSANASNDALPGDQVLYPVKRAVEAVEKTRVALVGSADDQTTLSLELAKRRADEAKQIVNDPDKKVHIAETVSDLKDELRDVNKNLETIKNTSAQNLSPEAVSTIKESTGQIKDALQQVKENLQTSTTTDDGELSEQVSVAKDLAKDTNVKTIEVVVAKHLEDGTKISTADVTTIINSALDAAASEIGDSKVHVDGAKTIVDVVKNEVKGLTNAAAVNRVSATTTALTNQISDVAAATKAASLQTSAVSAQVDKTILEAKALVASGDLTKAVDAIKQVNEASKEAEKISDTTIAKVKTVLPIVQVVSQGDASLLSPTNTVMLIVSTTLNQKTITTTASGTIVIDPKNAATTTPVTSTLK